MLEIYDIILYSQDEETGEKEFYSYQGDCSFMFDDITPEEEDCIEIDNPEQDVEILSALKALVNGLPEEYDDLHTKNLIENAKAIIDKNA